VLARSLRSCVFMPLQAQLTSKYHAENRPKPLQAADPTLPTVFVRAIPNKADAGRSGDRSYSLYYSSGNEGEPTGVADGQRLERLFGARVADRDRVEFHAGLPQGIQIALNIAGKRSIGEQIDHVGPEA
jgi:hypothetical protein